MRRALRSRSLRAELRTTVDDTEAEVPDATGLRSTTPAPATMSRRGLLGTVAVAGVFFAVIGAGQNVGGVFRRLALLAPRAFTRSGNDPNGFQVNKTAAYRGITDKQTGDGWRLKLDGPVPAQLTRAELMAMPQHTADLPIACVEGWSTGVQRWSGVALRDLAARAGLPDAGTLVVTSLQHGGSFGQAALAGNQIHHHDALLALRVNGADLSADHGYPARIVVPAAPGVHNTKWVTTLRFES